MRISDWSSDVCSSDLADQMLDLGFVHAIRKISAALPKQRQSLFFSATMPASIGQLASGFLREPVRVEVTPAATTVERIDQSVIFVEADRKRALLAEIMLDPAMGRTKTEENPAELQS